VISGWRVLPGQWRRLTRRVSHPKCPLQRSSASSPRGREDMAGPITISLTVATIGAGETLSRSFFTAGGTRPRNTMETSDRPHL
jgi:hypothetical protein